MNAPTPLFSVCIPAYNRAAVLPELLQSIVDQDFEDYEIVIAEDNSRERSQICAIANEFAARLPGKVRYIENGSNLGFDGNIRALVGYARGCYCLFMGNDDLLNTGALRALAGGIERHPDIGVVLRAYASFDHDPKVINQTFRYFPNERFFPAGPATAAALYRRSVVICGVVIHREAALEFVTTRHDGTLLYQIYLVANILMRKNGVYLPDIVALYRNGGVPEFGNAEAEKGKFVPRDRTVESSVQFMNGMLDIARDIEITHGQPFYQRVLADIAAYSYPVLSIQSDRSAREFIRYWWALCRVGFWRYPLFHLYFFSLLVLGARQSDRIITAIKRRLGYTPLLGAVSSGQEV
jgi:abequosyltransferase